MSQAESKETEVTTSQAVDHELKDQSVDGKTVRGLRRYEQSLHFVSLVPRYSGVVLNRLAVNDKSNDVTTVPQLLAKRDLTSTVTTTGVLLTQQNLCRQILDQDGRYLVVVKRIRPTLYHDIALPFEGNPSTIREKACEYQRVRSCQKAYGRIEIHTLETSISLSYYTVRRSSHSIKPSITVT